MPIVAADELLAFTVAAFGAAGVAAEAAEVVATELVTANLRGHDSHGVLHVPRYLESIDSGRLEPQAEAAVKRRSGSVAVFDVGWGFGFVAARRAASVAGEIALEHGIGCVALQRCSHVGRLGSYPEQIARRGLVGFALSSGTGPGGGVVAPYGGRERLFGTNPLSVAIPVDGDDPILVDLVTAAVAGGKIAVARQQGEPLPAGALLAPDGSPSTRPEDYFAGGVQLPFGGHKGYALSLTIEILANLLTGFPPPSSQRWERPGNPTLIAALDPARFVDRSWFDEMVAELRANTLSAPPASGSNGVRLPGARGFHCERDRRRGGIPLSREIWGDLAAVAERHRLTLPTVREGAL